MGFATFKAGNGLRILVNSDQVRAVRELPPQGPEGNIVICEIEFSDESTCDVEEHIFDVAAKLREVAAK